MPDLRPLLVALTIAQVGASQARATEPAGSAANGDPVARAEALFQEGRRLLEEGHAPAACPKLAESLLLDRATGTLLALAMCHEVDGHLASAWGEYREVVGRAKREGRADREEAARQYAHALEARLSTLSIAVPAAVAQIPGLVVQRDGMALESTAWSTAVAVDAGPHVVSAAAPGRLAFATTVVVRAVADHATVTVPLLVPEQSGDSRVWGAGAPEAGDVRADLRLAPHGSAVGPARFTTTLAGAWAVGEAGTTLATELGCAHGTGWGGSLRASWPTSERREAIDGGGTARLRSFALRGSAFRTFRAAQDLSLRIGAEVLWQLDRAEASGVADARSVWRSGWGLGVGGGMDVPLASWVAITAIASVDYVPSAWTGDLAVANRGDVLRASALRVLVGAGPRFTIDW